MPLRRENVGIIRSLLQRTEQPGPAGQGQRQSPLMHGCDKVTNAAWFAGMSLWLMNAAPQSMRVSSPL